MLKHHEGVRMRPYQCPALIWSVGVGHVIDPSHAAVKYEERKSLPIPAGAFLMWTKAAGKVLTGLVKRRNDERAMFLGG